jgi:hypothetical protein
LVFEEELAEEALKNNGGNKNMKNKVSACMEFPPK